MASKNKKTGKKLSLTKDMVRQAAQAAAEETDKQLASRIASMTKLTMEEIEAAFPEEGDLQKLEELMQIVKAEGDRQEKINALLEHPQKFAGITLTLLGKFV